MKVSILTTVFNRSSNLNKLYDSLTKQTKFNFEWIIVDDFSTDNTLQTAQSIQSQEKTFDIIVLKNNKNVGKTFSLNKAIECAKGEVTLIIDSDDYAMPNMIDHITCSWLKENRLTDEMLAEIVYERITPGGSPVQSNFPRLVRQNIVKHRYGNGLMGDYAETYKTKILKQYRFPKFNDETFLSEEFIWIEIGKKYDGIFLHEGLYISEYKNDGITVNSKRNMWLNPIGVTKVYEKRMSVDSKLFLKLKFIFVFLIFALKLKMPVKKIFSVIPNKIYGVVLLFPAILGEIVFSIKYQ